MAILALSVLALLVIAAAISDLATMEIPDWISVACVVLYPVFALACGQSWTAIGLHLAFAAAVFIAGFFAFQFGLMGGGDAKVIAAIAAWTGIGAFLPFVVVMAIAGGALAAVLLAARRLAKPGPRLPSFLNRLLDPARGVPYAVAIAVGVIFALDDLPITAGGWMH